MTAATTLKMAKKSVQNGQKKDGPKVFDHMLGLTFTSLRVFLGAQASINLAAALLVV